MWKRLTLRKGRRGDLAAAGLELPHFCVGHGDEIARLGHEVGDARPRHQLDEALEPIARGEIVTFVLSSMSKP